jgi:hypothetical protein
MWRRSKRASARGPPAGAVVSSAPSRSRSASSRRASAPSRANSCCTARRGADSGKSAGAPRVQVHPYMLWNGRAGLCLRAEDPGLPSSSPLNSRPPTSSWRPVAKPVARFGTTQGTRSAPSLPDTMLLNPIPARRDALSVSPWLTYREAKFRCSRALQPCTSANVSCVHVSRPQCAARGTTPARYAENKRAAHDSSGALPERVDGCGHGRAELASCGSRLAALKGRGRDPRIGRCETS